MRHRASAWRACGKLDRLEGNRSEAALDRVERSLTRVLDRLDDALQGSTVDLRPRPEWDLDAIVKTLSTVFGTDGDE